MYNPTRPENGHTNPGDSEPASTKDAEFQTALDNVRYLEGLESNQNASTFPSYGSIDEREAMSAARHGYDGIFSPVHSQGPHFSPLLEDSRGFNSFGTSQNHSDPYGAAIFSSNPTHNRKRNVSNCISNLDGSADARAAMSSTLRGGDSISGSVHSQGPHFSPFVEDSRGFNTSGTFRNNSVPYGAAMVSSYPTHYWNNSASNFLFMNETNLDHTKSNPEIWDLSCDSQQDVNYDKWMRLNDTSQMAFHNRAVAGIDEPHIESHYNLSQIARNDSQLCRISDVVASDSFYYSGENFAASGSSGYHRNENTPNVVRKIFQSSNKGEEIKALICKICEEETVQNGTKENALRSVDSLYYNFEGTNLMIHRSTHVLKATCNICGKTHAVENRHKSEIRCPEPFCKKRFSCRTRFYRHIPEHQENCKKYCWVCDRAFKEHVAENDSTTYVCCVCGFPSKVIASFEKHNQLHLPRSFCDLCKKEYHLEETLNKKLSLDKKFHGSEFKCLVCNNIFRCRIQLEEHFEGHVKYFSDLCRKSTSNGDVPSYQCPFCDDFKTSNADIFKKHLYRHADLRAFECETCERRYFLQQSLCAHTSAYKALPYKCGICEIRFYTIDLLLSHGLVKHLG